MKSYFYFLKISKEPLKRIHMQKVFARMDKIQFQILQDKLSLKKHILFFFYNPEYSYKTESVKHPAVQKLTVQQDRLLQTTIGLMGTVQLKLHKTGIRFCFYLLKAFPFQMKLMLKLQICLSRKMTVPYPDLKTGIQY